MLYKNSSFLSRGFFLIETLLTIILISCTALIIAQYQLLIQKKHVEIKNQLQALAIAMHAAEIDLFGQTEAKQDQYTITINPLPVILEDLPLQQAQICRLITVTWQTNESFKSVVLRAGPCFQEKESLHDS